MNLFRGVKLGHGHPVQCLRQSEAIALVLQTTAYAVLKTIQVRKVI